MIIINIIADFVAITRGGSGMDALPVGVEYLSKKHD